MRLDEYDKHYGVSDAANSQCVKKLDGGIENFPNVGKNVNPYYEGDFDASTDDDGRSKVNDLCPNLNNTKIVKSINNVYYEL